MARSNIITTRSGKKVRNLIPDPVLYDRLPIRKVPAKSAAKKSVNPSIGKFKPALKKPTEKANTDVQLVLSSAKILESIKNNGTLTLKVKFIDKDARPTKPCEVAVLTTHALKKHEATLPSVKFFEFSDDGSTTLKSDATESNRRLDPILADKDHSLPLGYSYLRHTRSLDRKLRRRS